MGKESCVTHRENEFFIIIKQGYVHLFNGSHACAALCYTFEYLTNIEVARVSPEHRDGFEPWVEASVQSLVERMISLYGRGTVLDALSKLESAGIVRTDRRRLGANNRYLFNFQLVSSLLSKRHVFTEYPESKIGLEELGSSPVPSPTASPVPSPKLDQYKEELVVSKSIEKEDSPNPSDSDLDLEDSLEDFIKNSSRRNRGPRIKPERKVDARVWERLASRETAYGREAFRRAWLRFLDWLPEAKGGIEHPLPYFIAGLDRWMEPDEFTLPAPSATSVLPADEGPPPPASAADPARDWVAEWNSIVTACPDQDWHPPANFKAVTSDPAFQEKFTRVCEVAQKIHLARGAEVGWLSLRWLFKSKDGMLNWRKVIGDLAWMAAEGSNGAPKKVDASTAFQRAIANQKKLIQDKKEKGSE